MFRMSRDTFTVLSGYLDNCPELSVENNGGRKPISTAEQLYMTLWYLGGTDSIVKIANLFGVSESSVIVCRERIMGAILSLKSRFIAWPQNETLLQTVDNFSRRNGFPGIIGALDGTHIEIKAPSENQQSYINRKKYHSLQLQAVCNSEMLFTDCFAGYPGSCHDSRVLRNSPLGANGLQLCNGNHIIADGGYPLRRWILTPYRDNGHLTQEQKNYNYKLSSNRVVVERAFGLLKGRFRRLRYLDTQKIQTAVEIIMTACVLHNVCLMQRDAVEDFLETDDDLNQVAQNLQFPLQENDAEGTVQRNAIARALYRLRQ